MLPPGCKITELGILNGSTVSAITDGAGPNVIVGGRGQPVHYLSPTYKSHEVAVKEGEKIMETGNIPKEYANMRDKKEANAASFNCFLIAYDSSWVSGK